MKACFICRQVLCDSDKSHDQENDDNLTKCSSTFEKVHSLNDATFEKCSKVIAVRKSHGLKYGDLVLTEENKSQARYHMQCYRRLTSLKRRYLETEITLPSSTPEAGVSR